MKYRPEIDGLRALAVTSVILFHAGLNIVSGGYVGVDIFFVISGFLITTIILSEIELGTFSIINFYERRSRRILPALFFVLLVSVPIAWVVLSPYDMKYYSKSLAYVSIFLSNTIFYKQSGYFDTGAELKPLLHTWSLGIEEQYYVFFPLLVVFIWRYCKNHIVHVFVAIFVISLFYANYMVQIKPKAAFFLLQYRLWELMAGSISAILVSKNLYGFNREKFKNILSIIGLSLLLFSIFCFDKSTSIPSFYTLIPILGASLFIIFATDRTVVARIFSLKPVVGIGLISFSAYLWHQPLFAFYRHKNMLEPSFLEMLTLVGLVLILAITTWSFVEQPFRNKNFLSRKLIFSIALVSSVVFITFGMVGYYSEGFIKRLTEAEKEINNYRVRNSDWRDGTCFLDLTSNDLSFSAECFDKNKHDNSILLWGDSHAAALYPGLSKRTKKIIQMTAGGCPPLLSDDYDGSNTNIKCVNLNKTIGKFVEKTKPSIILLHAVWDGYSDSQILEGINETLKYIKRTSSKSKVYIIGPVPQWKPTLPDVALRNHLVLNQESYLKMPLYSKLRQLEAHIELISKKQHAYFISPLSRMCRQDECLVVANVSSKFALTAYDYAHLTNAGSDIVSSYILQTIESQN